MAKKMFKKDGTLTVPFKKEIMKAAIRNQRLARETAYTARRCFDQGLLDRAINWQNVSASYHRSVEGNMTILLQW